MKTSRALLVWAALGICAVLVLGAMIWLTKGVLVAERDRVAAERERVAAENRADLEERTRLALWRMDALGASIMLRENGVAAMDYYGGTLETKALPAEVFLHFQFGEDRKANTPDLPSVDNPDLSTAAAMFPERKERVRLLRELLAANPLQGNEWAQLCGAVAQGEIAWQAVPKDAPLEKGYNKIQRENSKSDQQFRNDDTYQTNSNTTEKAQRAKALAQTVDNGTSQQGAPMGISQQLTEAGTLSYVGQMRAVWLGGELFLLRQVVWNHGANGDGKKSSVQGVWIDSTKLKNQLLHEAADLLPQAKLLPVEGRRAAEDPLAMVSFPFRLERNEIPAATTNLTKTPFGPALWVAWAAVILALMMSSLLVHGVMRLSERRASFVSAVTHELRTPLTTFRLYSDMLETGAVKAEKRGDYLRVLSREADRLSHLVENVLAFSKIERGSARATLRELSIAELLGSTRERLEERLATAGLTLTMDLETPSAARRVRVDSAAVEHVLFNLIDNAAKYAATGDPPVVEIRVESDARQAEIIVSDHGPGIPVSERGRIFRAFHKSAREAAESRPGVGLGLALSRRLAKSLGGSLECKDSICGATFVLRIPVVSSRSPD